MTHIADNARGRAVVMQPEDGPSYWQPVPANGHADPKLYPARTGFARLSMGFQTVAPSVLTPTDSPPPPSCPGLSRASTSFGKMDCRVKPGNDGRGAA